MSEQGLAARALAALLPSRRRANAASVRTVADLVREREQAEAEFATGDEAGTPSPGDGDEAGTPPSGDGDEAGTPSPGDGDEAGTPPSADGGAASVPAPDDGTGPGPVRTASHTPVPVPVPVVTPAVSPPVAQRLAETRRVAPRIGWGAEDGPDPRHGVAPVVAWDGGVDADVESGAAAGAHEPDTRASTSEGSDADGTEAAAAEPADPGTDRGTARDALSADADGSAGPDGDRATVPVVVSGVSPASPDLDGPTDPDVDRATVRLALVAADAAPDDPGPDPGIVPALPGEFAFGAGSAPTTPASTAGPTVDAAPAAPAGDAAPAAPAGDAAPAAPAGDAAPAGNAGDAAPAGNGAPAAAGADGDGTDGADGGRVRSVEPSTTGTGGTSAPAPLPRQSGAFPINVVTGANSAALATEAGAVPGLVAGGALPRASVRGEPPVRVEAAARRPSAVPALLSDAELREALGEDPEPEEAEPEPSVVAMTTASTRPAPTPPVRTGALAPPWVRAALMGAEPRSSATPEQAAATRALRRTFGVPQDPGPVTLAGVGPVAAVAVLPETPAQAVPETVPETVPESEPGITPEITQDGAPVPVPVPVPTRKPRRPTPRTLVGAPVPVRYRATRRDGEPVPGAEITAVDRSGVTVVDGIAGPDGRGRFVVQQPGPYILVGAAPGFQPGAAAVDAVGGTVDVDVLLVRSSSVAGVVRLDGEPVPHAQVTLVQDGEVVDMVQANRAGRFRIADLTVGEYALAVAADGCPPTVMVVAVPEEADLSHDVDLASPPS